MDDGLKQAQMQDVLQQLGYSDDKGRAVVEDGKSAVTGSNPEEASVIKMLCDGLSERLLTVGLILGSATVYWDTDESAAQVYQKLRRMQLISSNESALE